MLKDLAVGKKLDDEKSKQRRRKGFLIGSSFGGIIGGTSYYMIACIRGLPNLGRGSLRAGSVSFVSTFFYLGANMICKSQGYPEPQRYAISGMPVGFLLGGILNGPKGGLIGTISGGFFCGFGGWLFDRKIKTYNQQINEFNKAEKRVGLRVANWLVSMGVLRNKSEHTKENEQLRIEHERSLMNQEKNKQG